MIIQKLTNLVEQTDLTQPEVDSIKYRLTPLQQRLFIYLTKNKSATTSDIQSICSISNISDAAIKLNKKLLENGDLRHVSCIKNLNTDQYNELRTMGTWTLAQREVKL